MQDSRPISTILSLDPGTVAGIAIRGMGSGAPEVYEGSVYDRDTYSWITQRLSRYSVPEQRTLFVVENNAYGGLHIAKSLGKCIGVVEGLLLDIGAIQSDEDVVEVAAVTWRPQEVLDAAESAAGDRRKALKKAAVRVVFDRYKLALGPDGAEAVLINDWAKETINGRNE